MRAPPSALALAVLVGSACGPQPAPAVPPVRVPSTHRDPPAPVLTPSGEARTGRTVALVVSGDEERAREALVALVLAARAQDLDAIEALLAPNVYHLPTLRCGHARAAAPARVVAQRIAAQMRLAQVGEDARFEDLVEPDSIAVEPAATSFGPCVPEEILAGDYRVRFVLTPLGRRAFGVAAADGNAALLVRVDDRARVVAR